MISASSILARLKNESIKRNIPNQQMITLFLHEEFSRRLGKSKYKDKFILKGGFLLFSLGAGDTRATMDSDYLMKKLSNKEVSIKMAIKEIINIDNKSNIELEFLNLTRITEQNDYHGFRIKLVGKIGRTQTSIFVDFGVGDVIVPESKITALETIIKGFEKPKIRTYSMETVVAEKLDAILFFMEASSRMKDFYDIYYLAISKNFDGEILKDAIYTTFNNRNHLEFLKNIYELDKFKEIERIENMWKIFIKKEIRLNIKWNIVIDIILKLTLPICEAIESNQNFKGNWDFKEGRYY